MKKFNIKSAFLALLSVMFIVSCTDKFEEINSDPDRAKDAPATNVLAFTIRYYSDTFFDAWNNMNEPSTYGGYLAKIQYIDEARYVYRTGTVENKWYYGYRLLNNINEIKKKATADDAKNLLGVAKVLEVMVVQAMTDTWRDIPYSDAIKLSEGILLPKYDKQEDIYPALLTTLNEATTLFAAHSIDQLGEGDLLYDGDVEKWVKLANSLKLRLAMRISGVSPALAKTTVETVLASAASYPIMEDNDDNAYFYYPGSSPYQETWYEDKASRDDHSVSDVLVNALKSFNDPRLAVYAKPATADGVYRGFTIGAVAQPSLASVSRIGARFRDNAAGFSPFMNYAEVMFCVAEAAKLGWAAGMTAKDAYDAGVTASMDENGIADGVISTYLASGPGAFDNTLSQIYWQEWIALFKQGMEGWSLYRRTGIPSTHYIAPGTTYTGHNSPPFRYPYPQNELTLNGDNIATFAAEVNDDFWGKKMWWDTRAGVQ